ncbi:MAG: hypothetical protein A2506_01640 [Elusimicrobia bacterium RIFOXYD12_FULL_66_9]|nr:MAG: hypothetical protein A2506_01640 [Elusimicrobia bacterium RIFOXYD12_FULL_66_9]
MKSPRKTKAPARRLVVKKAKKAASPEMSAEEVIALEHISQRYEQSERAWQRMTSLPGGDETWNQVEEHLLTQGGQDAERRWKYFSK